MRGPELAHALEATTVQVRWVLSSGKQLFVNADAASILVKQGVYEGKARSGRVYWIRERDPRPEPLRDDNFRFERGMLLLHWNKPVDRKTVEIWLLALNRPKSPSSTIVSPLLPLPSSVDSSVLSSSVPLQNAPACGSVVSSDGV